MARIFRRNPDKDKTLFWPWLLPLLVCLTLIGPCAALAVDAASAPGTQAVAADTGATLHAAPTPATPPASQAPAVAAAPLDNHPWWFWPLALLGFCFILGIIAVMAGVGGGVLRDVCCMERPYIFTKHIYACASLVGAAVCRALWPLGMGLAMLAGCGVTVVIRICAATFRWSFPKA